jgi:hypothetical protein
LNAKNANSAILQPLEIYRTHMAEAKLRLLAAEKIAQSSTPVSGLSSLDMEFCFLQIRRIIELITFSAMKREEERYGKFRKQQHLAEPRAHGNASKDWNAPDILKRLISLSPHALPIPLAKATLQDNGITHFDRKQITLNHSRLIDIYEQCGGYMHGKNPLVDDYLSLVESERTKYIKAPIEVNRHLEFLRKLLWLHAAVKLDWSDAENPQLPDNPKSVWIVDFGTSQDEKVNIAIAEAEST